LDALLREIWRFFDRLSTGRVGVGVEAVVAEAGEALADTAVEDLLGFVSLVVESCFFFLDILDFAAVGCSVFSFSSRFATEAFGLSTSDGKSALTTEA